MKFTLSWLRDHLDTDAPLDRLLATLNTIGLEVEGVEDRAAALAPFRIARVVEAVQHPNADRLRALKVDIGDGTIRSVVCGAPNARAGMKAVAALPGAFVPGTGITLKAGEIRGVKSEAMLLSSREMGLGDDHSGIVDLPEDAPVGASYAEWAKMGDPVIEISVTPNRGDALAVRGVARDLAAAGIGTLKPWNPEPVAPAYPTPLEWVIDDPRACIQVLGRAVRGVTNGPSPQWMQDRLTAIGLRPINALVDVTNFFTFDLGRPLHVFDVAKVRGRTLTMRLGREGDEYLALNGKTYRPTPEDIVIADEAGVESLAAIVGGETTGCDETTREVFIECALFDPVRIALTGRRHGVHSDARARNERGLDPAAQRAMLEAATRMVIDLCGGEASTVSEAGAEPAWRRNATLRFERIAGLGGSSIGPDKAVASLEALGFGVTARDDASVTVSVPSWRNDVASSRSAYRAGGTELAQEPGLDPARAAAAAEGAEAVEAECDLLEEVLRLEGLDAIPSVSLPVASPLPLPALTARQSRAGLARRLLAARGLAEAVTYGFTARGTAALFGEVPEALRVENPIAADLDQMRPTPVATLLLAAGRNAARGMAGRVALRDRRLLRRALAGGAARHRRRGAHGPHAAPPAGALAPGGRAGRQGRRAGGAARPRRRAGRADGDDGRAGLLPSRPLRRAAERAEAAAGALRGAAPARALGARHRWASRGLRGAARLHPRAEAPPEGRARPAGLPARAARPRLPGGRRRARRQPAPRRARGGAGAGHGGLPLRPLRRGAAARGQGRRSPSRSMLQPRERTLTDAEIEAAVAKVVGRGREGDGGHAAGLSPPC